jgi:ComF family protein
VVRGAIKVLKYRLVSDLAREFVGLVPTSFFKGIPVNRRRAMVVPVPLHPTRERERGFNQAVALGSIVARSLHLPLRTDILYRTKHTMPQADIKNRSARQQNIAGVFAAKVSLRRKSVVVFDDVTTTRATLNEAAAALKRAGASWVWGVAMAH